MYKTEAETSRELVPSTATFIENADADSSPASTEPENPTDASEPLVLNKVLTTFFPPLSAEPLIFIARPSV